MNLLVPLRSFRFELWAFERFRCHAKMTKSAASSTTKTSSLARGTGLCGGMMSVPVCRPFSSDDRPEGRVGRSTRVAYIYSVLDGRPGTFDAAELPFVFDNNELLPHYCTGDPAASVLNKQSTARVSFECTGNPEHSGLPHWRAYSLRHAQP